MPTTTQSNDERKRIMDAFLKLPESEREKTRLIWDHLRYLWVLWRLDEMDPSCSLTQDEKRHVLLAYKSLQMVWFKKLPEADKQPFAIYIRYDVPEESIPAISGAFSASTNELASQCDKLSRPIWVYKNATVVKISVESFPYQITQ